MVSREREFLQLYFDIQTRRRNWKPGCYMEWKDFDVNQVEERVVLTWE
jgi:hypothetical protein